MSLLDRAVLYIGVPLAAVFSVLAFLDAPRSVPPPPQLKLLSVNNTIVIKPGAACGDGTYLCCTQDATLGVNGSSAYVNPGDIVQWIVFAANVKNLDVKFPNTSSPFFDLPNDSSNSVNAGMPISSAPSNTTWIYQSVTWNNGSGSCKNVAGSKLGIGPLGIIMRPPE